MRAQFIYENLNKILKPKDLSDNKKYKSLSSYKTPKEVDEEINRLERESSELNRLAGGGGGETYSLAGKLNMSLKQVIDLLYDISSSHYKRIKQLKKRRLNLIKKMSPEEKHKFFFREKPDMNGLEFKFGEGLMGHSVGIYDGEEYKSYLNSIEFDKWIDHYNLSRFEQYKKGLSDVGYDLEENPWRKGRYKIIRKT